MLAIVFVVLAMLSLYLLDPGTNPLYGELFITAIVLCLFIYTLLK